LVWGKSTWKEWEGNFRKEYQSKEPSLVGKKGPPRNFGKSLLKKLSLGKPGSALGSLVTFFKVKKGWPNGNLTQGKRFPKPKLGKWFNKFAQNPFV